MVPRSDIRSALRRIWLWSPARRAAKKRAKWNGTKFYRCEVCHRATAKVEIDHRLPVGPSPGSKNDDGTATWDMLIARLFCPADGLQALCRPCHAKRTQQQRRRKAS